MAKFQELDDIYNEVNTIIDKLLKVHSKLDKREKQITQINVLRLNKIKELKQNY